MPMVLARTVVFHVFYEILDSGNGIRSHEIKELHYMNPCQTLRTEVGDGHTKFTSKCVSLYFLKAALCIGRYSKRATKQTSTYSLVS